jgi:hypothetical protein
MRWRTLPQNMSEPTSVTAALLSAVCDFHDSARRWHSESPAGESVGGGVAAKALHLHALNFALWHHEDAVRRPGADDHDVAATKRRIDDLNGRRNAAIEDIDAAVLDQIELNPSAPLYTETPATIVDRLSVLTLRVAHTDQTERLAVLNEQYDDLRNGLEVLLARLQAGEVKYKLYRQFKSAAQRSHCDLFDRGNT